MTSLVVVALDLARYLHHGLGLELHINSRAAPIANLHCLTHHLERREEILVTTEWANEHHLFITLDRSKLCVFWCHESLPSQSVSTKHTPHRRPRLTSSRHLHAPPR